VLPNGVATGLDIAFSNTSFAFITLSFYTMCKSSAPLFLLLFAFIWRIETPTWSLALTVTIISGGLLLLVAGEVEFDMTGFLLVMAAACMSGLRWTITQVLLQVRTRQTCGRPSRGYSCGCAPPPHLWPWAQLLWALGSGACNRLVPVCCMTARLVARTLCNCCAHGHR
jgi:drug/metabolite transporter (DMT)-like permease